jgi:hypothetical protein
VSNEKAKDIFMFALEDFVEGCKEVKNDDKFSIILVNLREVPTSKARNFINEYKNEFEYYAVRVDKMYIEDMESFDSENAYDQGIIDDFLEDAFALDDPNHLYIHITCDSNLHSIKQFGLLPEEEIDFRIGDRENSSSRSKSSSKSSKSKKSNKSKKRKGSKTIKATTKSFRIKTSVKPKIIIK